MSAREGNFQSLDELTECMKASMLIPGVAGDVVRLKVRTVGMMIAAAAALMMMMKKRRMRRHGLGD